ncbi:MAG: response regulator, partial [Candidatus Binataceae bacterium]
MKLLLSSRKTTVIVLDDDRFVCRALKTQLQILGFGVLVFHSAESLLSGNLPDGEVCLLADIYLPGMNGNELCRHLYAAGVHLPTILMSGRE